MLANRQTLFMAAIFYLQLASNNANLWKTAIHVYINELYSHKLIIHAVEMIYIYKVNTCRVDELPIRGNGIINPRSLFKSVSSGPSAGFWKGGCGEGSGMGYVD